LRLDQDRGGLVVFELDIHVRRIHCGIQAERWLVPGYAIGMRCALDDGVSSPKGRPEERRAHLAHATARPEHGLIAHDDPTLSVTTGDGDGPQVLDKGELLSSGNGHALELSSGHLDIVQARRGGSGKAGFARADEVER